MKLLKLLIGQVLTGFSIALVVASAFGSFAITTCNIGMANITGLSLGVISMIIEFCIIAFNYFNGEKCGLCTLTNAIFGGFIIDFFLNILVFPTNFFIRLLFAIIGTVLLAFSSYLTSSSGYGQQSSNALMTVLLRKTQKPIRIVRTCEELLFMIIGLIGHGGVGIFTLILSVSFGIVMDYIFRLLHYNPEETEHKYLF